MSIIFSDNFSGDTPGSPAAGWSGSSEVNTNGVNPTPNRGCWQGDMWIFGPPLDKGTIFFGFYVVNGAGAGPICTLSNENPLTPGGGNLLSLYLEDDNSLSLYTVAGQILADPITSVVANTMNTGDGYSVAPEAYIFVSLGFSFTKDSITSDIAVGANLVVNGGEGQASGNYQTAVNANSTFLTKAAINQVEFRGAGGNLGASTIANVGVDNVDGAPYPNPTPPGMLLPRVSQIAIETLEHPTNSNARVSQMAIEMIELPTNSNARVSQIVIELITGNNPTIPGGFAQYVKRRNMFSNS